ncbi:syntaxin of plants 52 [Rhynchospora pubera]|uniref:Syntaxin of plants 52 n=1 Tax=Rhynchospora pubera TaxID=906938 RepID=A0AAV8GIK9_9POAL|nr:syntaxin of plants 52 [Rhynchospora pubera]
MASPADLWVKECGEASRLADEVSKMLSERGSLPPSGPETQRFLSGLRRRITILGTRLGKLEADLASLPRKSISDKEMHKRHELLSNLRAREKQMASALNMSYAADREDLLGSSKGTVDEVKRATGLDNQGIVGLQRQIMREQDEGLEKLEETVYSTKHIALAVNEELNLHTRLIDTLDQRVETDSRLQRVQKRLAILNKRNKAGCSCMCLLLSVLAINCNFGSHRLDAS